MVCSPISSARLLPTRADAKISAAPDVPLSTSSFTGIVTEPSPAVVAMACGSPSRTWRFASVPFATKRRASASPASFEPPDVRRASTTSEVAPALVSSAMPDFA